MARIREIKTIIIEIYISKDIENAKIDIKNKTSNLKAEDLDKIFEPFYSKAYNKRELGSMGLGLSICKNILAMHNGSINTEVQNDSVIMQVLIPLEKRRDI